MVSLEEIPGLAKFGRKRFVLIAGPCVIENSETPLEVASHIAETCEKIEIPWIFKSSFYKANRTRHSSFTGIGFDKAINILARIRSEFEVPVTTDVHSIADIEAVGEVVDVIQIPAFLCRQSDLLYHAARSGKWVNIKKGQFMSAGSMIFAVEKILAVGNNRVFITERGTTFGYEDLVVDFRGFPVMRSHCPLIFDCTHSLQRPNQKSGIAGGRPDLIGSMARAALAFGVDGLFIETHPDPKSALSDGANMLQLAQLESVLERLSDLDDFLRNSN